MATQAAPTSTDPHFLPVRTSARKSFNTCEWAWDKAYLQLLKPLHTKPAFRFGTLVHSSLEKFYRRGGKRGPHPAKTFERLYRKDVEAHAEFGLYADEEWVSAHDLGVAMMKGYVETYGKDDRYRVVATEQPFHQPVHETVLVKPTTSRSGTKVEKGVKKQRRKIYRFTYVGVLDGIWLDTWNDPARLLLVDHKTAGSIDSLLKTLPLDMQSTAYWTWGVDWLVEQGMLKRSADLDGLLYNMMAKLMPDERPTDDQGRALNKPTKAELLAEYDREAERQGRGMIVPKTVEAMMEDLRNRGLEPDLLGSPSKNQPAKKFERFPSFRGEAEREVAREMALGDYIQMNEIIKGNRKPRKMYPGGPFGCAGCAVKDICELHETGADYQAMQDQTMVAWDPYAQHELLEAR